MCVCMHVMYVCMYVCMCVRVCVYIYTCMYPSLTSCILLWNGRLLELLRALNLTPFFTALDWALSRHLFALHGTCLVIEVHNPDMLVGCPTPTQDVYCFLGMGACSTCTSWVSAHYAWPGHDALCVVWLITCSHTLKSSAYSMRRSGWQHWHNVAHACEMSAHVCTIMRHADMILNIEYWRPS